MSFFSAQLVVDETFIFKVDEFSVVMINSCCLQSHLKKSFSQVSSHYLKMNVVIMNKQALNSIIEIVDSAIILDFQQA